MPKFRQPFYVVGRGPDGVAVIRECRSEVRATRCAAAMRLAGCVVEPVSTPDLVGFVVSGQTMHGLKLFVFDQAELSCVGEDCEPGLPACAPCKARVLRDGQRCRQVQA